MADPSSAAAGVGGAFRRLVAGGRPSAAAALRCGARSVAADGGRRAPSALSWHFRAACFCALALLAAPLLLVAVAVRLVRRRSGLVGLAEKRSGAGPALRPGQVLVHGVSLGEVNLMRPLVPLVESALGTRCLLTTTTETGRAQLDQLFPTHQRAFFPFDLPWAVRRFLGRSRPRLVVLLEFELWPLFLCACFARGVPVAVVNAKISERSFRRFRAVRALVRPLFGALTLVLAQNAQWGARLLALGVRREALVVSGSMKADIVRRAEPSAAQAEADRLGLAAGRPVLLLASTSAAASAGASEEAVVLGDRLAAWQARGWQVVICPRHPERGGELVELVRRLGGQPRRSSLGERLAAAAPAAGPAEVMIVDEIGRLAALYAWTAAVDGLAVVGGGLGSGRGGQNMLEAAAHGCCTVVGWDTRNFPDAMALLRHADGVAEVHAGSVAAVLDGLAGDRARRRALGAAGERAWRAGKGAIARVVAALAARGGG